MAAGPGRRLPHWRWLGRIVLGCGSYASRHMYGFCWLCCPRQAVPGVKCTACDVQFSCSYCKCKEASKWILYWYPAVLSVACLWFGSCTLLFEGVNTGSVSLQSGRDTQPTFGQAPFDRRFVVDCVGTEGCWLGPTAFSFSTVMCGQLPKWWLVKV